MADDAQKTLPCPDCGQTVSRLAASCPHCGRPMEAVPQLVEQTAKKYKMIQLAGLGIGAVAILFVILFGMTEWTIFRVLASLVGLAAVGTIAVGVVLAWWHHG